MRREILVAATLTLAACGPGRVESEGIWLETREGGRTLESMHGQPAPQLELSNWINSEGVTLEELHGHVVLIDFWGVWCGPCRALTPTLIELHESYSDQGLVIIGIHTPAAADQAPAYIKEHGIPYAVGFDMEGRTIDAYNVDGYPDLYLIDRAGSVRYADLAQGAPNNIEETVRKLLAESDVAEERSPARN